MESSSDFIISVAFAFEPLANRHFNHLAGIAGEVLNLAEQVGIEMDGQFHSVVRGSSVRGFRYRRGIGNRGRLSSRLIHSH
jgi:hypothetical protein